MHDTRDNMTGRYARRRPLPPRSNPVSLRRCLAEWDGASLWAEPLRADPPRRGLWRVLCGLRSANA